MTTTATTHPPIHFASLKHRLICMVYEAFLLFGVFFGAGFLFDVVTMDFHGDALRHWRQLFLFLVLGIYFTYFWRKNGQTLPMQTWRIKVVSTTLQPLTFKQACIRYCVAWMWLLPALSVNFLFHYRQWHSIGILFLGILIWALTSRFDKDGQFLHDKLAGTLLISLPKSSAR